MHRSLVYLLKIWPVFNAINPLRFDFKLICIIIITVIIINNNYCTCSCHTQI